MPKYEEMNEQTDRGQLLKALGGAALVIVGVTLMLSHPTVRKAASQIRLSSLVSAALPGLERLMRMRTA